MSTADAGKPRNTFMNAARTRLRYNLLMSLLKISRGGRGGGGKVYLLDTCRTTSVGL